MNQNTFQTQVGRLVNTFGKQAYPDERVQLMWAELNTLSDEAWKRIVGVLITDQRHPPLMPEIRALASVERERSWAIEKANHRRESEQSIHNIFDGEMVSSICKTIHDRLTGRVSDEAFKNFTQGLKKLTGASCRYCDGSGLVFQTKVTYEFLYRCVCNEGAKHPTSYPSLFGHLRGVDA